MEQIISKTALLILTFTTALIIFNVNIHSDLLFLDSLMVDIFRMDGAWSNWKLTPAPAYFPDMLIYAVSYFLIPTPALRITFVCVIQVWMLTFACIKFAKIISPLHSSYQSNLIIIIISAFSLVAANSSMWLFFNSTNNHFSALLFPILIGWIIFRYWYSKKLHNIFWIINFVFLGAASTPVFSLSFTIPFFVFSIFVIILFYNEKYLRNFLFKVIFYVLVGHTVAYIFNTLILPYDSLGHRVPITIESAQRSLFHFINATKATFDSKNIFAFTLSIFSILAIIIIIFDFFKRFSFSVEVSKKITAKFLLVIPTESWRYYIVLLFFFIALPTCVIGSIVSGGVVDLWAYRYFAFPIALGLLLFTIKFDEKINRKMCGNSLFINSMVFSLLLIIAAVGTLSTKNLFLSSERASIIDLLDKGIKNSQDAIAECIKREEVAGFKFQAGVADYWSARGLVYKTNNISYILPVTNNLQLFFWMTTLGPLLTPDKYGINTYNFLVIKKSGTTTQFNLTPETIGKFVPIPSKVVDCENTDSSLWLYSNSQLNDVVQKIILSTLFSFGRSQKFSILESTFDDEVGRYSANARFANSINDNSVYLAYEKYKKNF